MSGASQQLYPVGTRHIAFVDDSDSYGGDLSVEIDPVKMDQISPQSNDQDLAEIDRIISLFDSEEYQVREEIVKLALKIENLQTRDKMLTESLGAPSDALAFQPLIFFVLHIASISPVN